MGLDVTVYNVGAEGLLHIRPAEHTFLCAWAYKRMRDDGPCSFEYAYQSNEYVILGGTHYVVATREELAKIIKLIGLNKV